MNYTGDSYNYPKADFYTDDSAVPNVFLTLTERNMS